MATVKQGGHSDWRSRHSVDRITRPPPGDGGPVFPSGGGTL